MMSEEITLETTRVFPRFRHSIGIGLRHLDQPPGSPIGSANTASIEELRELHLKKCPPPVPRKSLLQNQKQFAENPSADLEFDRLKSVIPVQQFSMEKTADSFKMIDLESILLCLDSPELHIRFAAGSALLDLMIQQVKAVSANVSAQQMVVKKAMRLHNDPDPALRNLALQILSVLASTGVSEVINLAITDLEDESNPSYLREQAAKAIASLCVRGDMPAVNALASTIRRESMLDNGIALRVECLLAISKVCTPGCHRALATVKDALKDRCPAPPPAPPRPSPLLPSPPRPAAAPRRAG